MVGDMIRQIALEQLVAAIRHPDPRVRDRYAEMFWDLQYLYRFGVPRIPPPELVRPFPPEPQPDPSPFSRWRLHEEVIMGLIDISSGDPDPEPMLKSVLNNPRVRLAAAKDLAARLSTAIQQLDKEIKRLEQSI